MRNAKKTEVFTMALERFNRALDATNDERRQAVEDRRFCDIAGATWEGDLLSDFSNKPRLEVNKVKVAVDRVRTDYRSNSIGISFSANSDEDQDLADICTGMLRLKMNETMAQFALFNAFAEGVSGGLGAFRVSNRAVEGSDEQEVFIEPLVDATICAYWDPDSKLPTKEDARYAFAISRYTRERYLEEFDSDPASFPVDTFNFNYDWNNTDGYYVAEYYVKEMVKRTSYRYINMIDDSVEEADERNDEAMEAMGYEFDSEVTKKVTKIRKYILSGAEILQDCGYIAGKHLPIIPFLANYSYVDGLERFHGIVRFAKDAQRIKNMQLSQLAQLSALSPRAKPVFFPEQIKGLESLWAEDNVNNYAFLLQNMITDSGGNPVVGRPAPVEPPVVPPALVALLQTSADDLKQIVGDFDATQQVVSQVSGKAYDAVQTQIDYRTQIYLEQFRMSLERLGVIWLSMAKEVYTEPNRTVKTTGELDAFENEETLNVRPSYSPMIEKNDISKASFKPQVVTGASSRTKREAARAQIVDLLPLIEDPVQKGVLVDILLYNTEGEESKVLRDFAKARLIASGVIETQDESPQAQQQPQGVAGEQQDAQQQATSELEQAVAIEALAKAQKAEAETEGIKAKTLKTLVEIEGSRKEQLATAGDVAEQLSGAQ